MNEILNIESIDSFHKILGLTPPDHPLISIISDKESLGRADFDEALFNVRFSTKMYAIMYKDNISGSLSYGRNTYDFQDGTLIFVQPGQVLKTPFKSEVMGKRGWTLLFHPDLLHNSNLATKMNTYNFFSYESNEALHLSNKEKVFVAGVIEQIKGEIAQNIDQHSQKLIVSNLELFLNYALRFYDRQFFTRTKVNSDYVTSFEKALNQYFENGQAKINGIPTAVYFGEQLNLSPNYLSDLLKRETGKGIKEYTDEYLIAKAKILLLNSSISVSELAYELGFDYPQSFTRLFRKKTGHSPKDFRTAS